MLKFNLILSECKLDPKSVQLVRHQDRGPSGGTPYSLLREDRSQFEFYQMIQGREIFRREFIASFVVTPSRETLFVDLFRVGELRSSSEAIICPIKLKSYDAGKLFVYDLTLDDRMSDFSKRLVLNWGEGYRSWVQRAEKQNKDVIEIRKQFEEPKFPDYFSFQKRIEDIPTLYPTWQSVLRVTKGVYLLVCKKTGAQYVGSATGDDGFFGRWTAYAADGHGGNKLLKERNQRDYTVSILETVGSKAQRSEVLALENLWKEKLGSRAERLGDEFGLNAN
ncbi:GIY-YIG nuclease family protein [Bradyrhizobium genosp. L]|uniref:GIY-YIG nuclease family protein n=1 Tax=Bradyrhizobium genosp. L TaxID=83637 RepID=UPI0018A25D84|nr:GIY-YIG nuclease family protein [Bradyrhizobium genosp. L]QPF86957.1 GIY-YIG nuclease family protein [Bradyrhizobium genosp. L]